MLLISLTLFSIIHRVGSLKHCLDVAIQHSQRCDNNQKLYFQTEGLASGFGSEFNYYLIYDLLDGIYQNRRLVSVRTGDEWPYDCNERLGWGCYLQFPCIDSVLSEVDQIELSENNAFHNKGSVSHGRAPESLLANAYSEIYNKVEACDTFPLGITNITSIIAKYLFKPNHHSQQFIDRYNSKYNLSNKKYLALQVRTTDKHAEMDDVTWAIITNMTAIAEVVLPHLIEHGIQDIYISTDDCDLMANLSLALNVHRSARTQPPYNIQSPCYINHEGALADINGSPIRTMNAKQTLRLLAEIVMLVGGEVFVGGIQSNLVRLVYRLRYPQQANKFVYFKMSPEKAMQENNNLDNLQS